MKRRNLLTTEQKEQLVGKKEIKLLRKVLSNRNGPDCRNTINIKDVEQFALKRPPGERLAMCQLLATF